MARVTKDFFLGGGGWTVFFAILTSPSQVSPIWYGDHVSFNIFPTFELLGKFSGTSSGLWKKKRFFKSIDQIRFKTYCVLCVIWQILTTVKNINTCNAQQKKLLCTHNFLGENCFFKIYNFVIMIMEGVLQMYFGIFMIAVDLLVILLK